MEKRNIRIELFIVAALFIIIISIVTNSNNNLIVPQSNMMHMHSMVKITSEQQFVFEMVPHHQEAVDSATIITQNTKNNELKVLANQIVTTQTQEIQMMDEWKKNWYENSNYQTTYMNMMPNLTQYSGEQQDKAFLYGMIMHHQMAVEMARQVLDLNLREEVADFANDVIKVQSEEIQQMQIMLERYQ